MWTDERIAIAKEYYLAIERGDVQAVLDMFHNNPWLLTSYDYDGKSLWLTPAVQDNNREMVDTLLDLGYDINTTALPLENSPLCDALSCGHFPLARHLLDRGAKTQHDRPIISLINKCPEPSDYDLFDRLLSAGADINELYQIFYEDLYFTALDQAGPDTEIGKYLGARGAKTSDELQAHLPQASSKVVNRAELVVEYVQEHFGNVHKKSLIELVPDGIPITIHANFPTDDQPMLTLFTTGMSERAMIVPDGDEDFQFAELMIQLPSDWATQKDVLARPEYRWPLTWLRKIARYPHVNHTWLGGVVTVFANNDPPEPLGPGVPFTCFLLITSHRISVTTGSSIALYQLIPLYTEERDLELREGYESLVKKLDTIGSGFIVNMTRPNVAKNVS